MWTYLTGLLQTLFMDTLNLLYLWITSYTFIYLCFLATPLIMVPKYAHKEAARGKNSVVFFLP